MLEPIHVRGGRWENDEEGRELLRHSVCIMSYGCIPIGQLVKCVHVLKSEYRIHTLPGPCTTCDVQADVWCITLGELSTFVHVLKSEYSIHMFCKTTSCHIGYLIE